MRTSLVLAIVLASAGTASADKADALFKKGKKLLAEKKYADACSAFSQVDKLDPGIGAKLNAAKCFEEWGKLATAYHWYEDAEKMATDTKDDRAAKIRELMEELDTNVPRITINVPDGADPDVLATLTLDGAPFPAGKLNKEERVDPGPHLIEFTVVDEKKKKTVPLERGGSSEITLDIPKGTGKKKPKPTPDPGGGEAPEPEVARPGRTQRIAGVSLIAGGIVGIGVAGVLTVSARGKYKDALDTHCMGMTNACNDEGLQITQDARGTANIATVITIVGGAAIVGGIVLYVIAPKAATDEKRALYLTPVVGDDGGGIVFGGRY